MPRFIKHGIIILTTLALIPPALILRQRFAKKEKRPIHFIHDMDAQEKFKAQSVNSFFADGRSMRPPVEGTLARGQLREDDHLYRGLVNGDYAADFPLPVTMKMVERGQEQFNIYCAPCHGFDGYGGGSVATRADELQEGTWVPPTSLHSEQVLERVNGHLFNSITNGIRTMPAYASQIEVEDRWAIVAYVRALQKSQRADKSVVPASTLEAMP